MRSVRKGYLPPERIISASRDENQSSVLKGCGRRFRTACVAASLHVTGQVRSGWRKATKVAAPFRIDPAEWRATPSFDARLLEPAMGVALGQTPKSAATESLRRHAHHGTSKST